MRSEGSMTAFDEDSKEGFLFAHSNVGADQGVFARLPRVN